MIDSDNLIGVVAAELLDVDGAVHCVVPAAHADDDGGLILLADPADVAEAHAVRLVDAAGVALATWPTRAGHDLHRFVGLLESRLAGLP
jgi:hypothetical protein